MQSSRSTSSAGLGGFGGPISSMSSFDSLFDDSAPTSISDEQREAIYRQSLQSLQRSSRCGAEGRDPRAVLDRVFNACLADTAPFGAAYGLGRAAEFPPMPSDVEASDKQPAPPPPPPPAAVGVAGQVESV